MPFIRLDKFISSQLVEISRSEVKNLCKRGYVCVDGVTARSSDIKIDPEKVCVTVGDREVGYKKNLYIMLNKPAGVVCATRDGLSATVLELLPPELRRSGLFPAGRLDKDTEGFTLITDDGGLAHKMLSPKSHVPKKYFVRLESPLKGDEASLFADGIVLEDGTKCLPARLESGDMENECFVIVHQGMYHQVKRMFETVGNKVVYLKRIMIGGLELDPALDVGKARELEDFEVEKLVLGKKQVILPAFRQIK